MNQIAFSSYTDDQKKAMDMIIEWIKHGGQEFKLGGLAGTGKSTLIGNLPKFFPDKRIKYCAFTGKAAKVLRTKKIDAHTIHSTIYMSDVKYNAETELFEHKYVLLPSIGCDIVVIDEASTVSLELYQDLKKFGVKMLFVGDHGQLPPVGTDFNLIDESRLDCKLQQIHRQAWDSGIIRMATAIRQGREIAFHDGKDTRKCHYSEITEEEFLNFDQIITGKNVTRVSLNQRCRELMGYDEHHPIVNDKIIVLKNDTQHGLFNGQIGKITSIAQGSKGNYKIHFIDVDDEHGGDNCALFYPRSFNNPTNPSQIRVPRANYVHHINFCDFAYAITVHKSQGSEWKNVLFVNDRMCYYDRDFYNRLLYTAVTRASQKITIAEL